MIDHLLNQDCEITRIKRDRYGDIIESDPVPTKCRAIEEYKMVKNNAAEEVVSSITFWLHPTIDISNKNIENRRIKYDGIDYMPISVRNKRDTFGSVVFKVVSV